MHDTQGAKNVLVGLYTVYAWMIGILCTGFYGSIAIVLSVFDSTGNVVHKCGQLWGKTILTCIGIRVLIEGKQHFLEQDSQILLANHQGILDILVFEGYLPLQFRWIARKNLFDIPILGWSMKRAGYIPIEREGKKRMIKSIELAVEKVNRGTNLLVFPEGTRSYDGKLGEFKKGSLLIIKKSSAPVVPILIDGSYRLLPRGSLRLRPGKIKIKVFPAIITGKLNEQEQNELLEKVHVLFSDNLESRTKT